MMFRVAFAACVSLGSSIFFAGLAAGQDFPARPIRFVQPFPPGGAVDTISRLVGERLAARLGQQVVVDNRPGANGAIAVNIVAVAPADGYTIMSVAQAFLTHQSTYRDFKYDVRKDITPIIQGANFPLVLVVHPSVPARSVKELIDLAKAKSGALSYGDNGGIGASGHIAGELFKQHAGVDVIHVPYKGAAPMYIDLLGGQIHMAFAHITSILPHIQAGKVRALATTASSRLPALVDVPTTAEAGVPGVNNGELWGVIGPARMPQAVVNRLNREIAEIIKSAPLHDRLVGEGAQIVAAPPEKFSEFIHAAVPRVAEVLSKAGIKPGNF